MTDRRLLLAISVLAGCTSTAQARKATMQELRGASSQGGPDETRGIVIDRPRLGFDLALQVRRSRNGVPHELHDGDTVMTGDRMRATVQTSEDAYLYLAFCAHQELTIYPPQGGIRTRAGELILVPQAGAELVFDGDLGTEVLYVILSRTELSMAGPHLEQALATQRPREAPVDCKASLAAKRAKPPSNQRAARSSTAGSTKVPTSSSSGVPLPSPPPDPDFERSPGDSDAATGPGKAVDADGDGIAVVRHTFPHVPQAPPP